MKIGAMGLCVKGLDSARISQMLEGYAADCIKGYKLGAGQSMFMEGYLLGFDEVSGIIPVKHHHLFDEGDSFMGMSGYVVVPLPDGGVDERVIMLLLDESSEYAYLLCLDGGAGDGDRQVTVIRDFLEGAGA